MNLGIDLCFLHGTLTSLFIGLASLLEPLTLGSSSDIYLHSSTKVSFPFFCTTCFFPVNSRTNVILFDFQIQGFYTGEPINDFLLSPTFLLEDNDSLVFNTHESTVSEMINSWPKPSFSKWSAQVKRLKPHLRDLWVTLGIDTFLELKTTDIPFYLGVLHGVACFWSIERNVFIFP